jgi:PHD/YefM family antitoxin component YafN of YafNO toxin-antitoxin module
MHTEAQYVVDENGQKMAVILSLELYEQILEDLHDLAIVAERRSEKPISFADMKHLLEADESV